jgi:hypothetical protein
MRAVTFVGIHSVALLGVGDARARARGGGCRCAGSDLPGGRRHHHHHKDIYIDKETLMALSSFAYDRKEELWKIIWHNRRWSEDTSLTGPGYAGWEGIPEPRDLRLVSDIIVNTQTGTGNRIEFWDSNGVPLKNRGKIRRYIDSGPLTKGR